MANIPSFTPEEEQKKAIFAKFEGGKLLNNNKYSFLRYMEKCTVNLGRGKKNDIDVSSQGGGNIVSRDHAKIFYDFLEMCYKMEILSERGCYIEGVLYKNVGETVVLKSGFLVKIGVLKFWFVLPEKSFRETFNEWFIKTAELFGAEALEEAAIAELKARTDETGGADQDRARGNAKVTVKARTKPKATKTLEDAAAGADATGGADRDPFYAATMAIVKAAEILEDIAVAEIKARLEATKTLEDTAGAEVIGGEDRDELRVAAEAISQATRTIEDIAVAEKEARAEASGGEDRDRFRAEAEAEAIVKDMAKATKTLEDIAATEAKAKAEGTGGADRDRFMAEGKQTSAGVEMQAMRVKREA